jgi:hypothetical protein
MTSTAKALIAIGVAAVLVLLGFPVLINMMTLPGQTSQQFYTACAAALGTRAGVVANPPQEILTPHEVLLKITQTATTLGFGRQGATVTVAIAIRATGLANAANPADSTTLRYAHSALIDDGAGALGLPLSWATPAELMTPEVSTAMAIDRMVDSDPQWRDSDPAQLAAEITGIPAGEFTTPAAAAAARLTTLTAPATEPPNTLPALTSTPAPSAATPTTAPQPAAATAVLNGDEVSSALATAPEAAHCLTALTAPLPPPATGPNPAGDAIAAAAQRTVGADPRASAAAPTEPDPPDAPGSGVAETNSAQFVSDVLGQALGEAIPTTIAEQLRLGYRVSTEPEPGDVVYTDISADEGPHLAGIAVADDTMVTVLPGHPAPQRVRVGPNNVIRRIEGASAA